MGPPRFSVLDVPIGRPVEVFRIVRSDDPEDPVFLNSLRSHYEMSEPPRRVERSSTAIHMGISVYLEAHMAHSTGRRFERLGGYVAQLSLAHGYGFNFAHTGHPLHLTVWADPVKLLAAVADIEPIEH
jgi:hypothetical protein